MLRYPTTCLLNKSLSYLNGNINLKFRRYGGFNENINDSLNFHFDDEIVDMSMAEILQRKRRKQVLVKILPIFCFT